MRAIVVYLFSLVGFGMLVAACSMYFETNSFLSKAAITQGAVIKLLQSTSRGKITYRPVVRFNNKNGDTVEFVSAHGSRPPRYTVGQEVEVLYQPTDPHNAEINAFFPLWGGSVIMGIMGGVFFLLGSGIILVGIYKREKYKGVYVA
jgi:small-conductance mechanosensitive channel